jgi:Flp pilus assembly protein TadD
MKDTYLKHFKRILGAMLVVSLLAACASRDPAGYGLSSGPNADALKRQEAMEKTAPPDSEGLYLALVGQMQDRGLYFASLAHISAFEKKYGATPDIELLRADALRETGQLADSDSAYRALLNTKLASLGYHGLGLLAARNADFATAVPALSQAVALDPTNVSFLNDLGFALLSDGQLNAARVPVAQAAELAPDNLKVISNLALYLLLSTDQARADDVMDKAKLPPASRVAVRRLAIEIRGRIGAEPRPVASLAGDLGGPVVAQQKNSITAASNDTVPLQSVFQRFGRTQ